MNTYKSLGKQTFSKGKYSIVPIRMEDRFSIMKWRNEQMYHLRQSKFLTIQDQNNYFKTTVNSLFNQEQPNHILFSYLIGDKCIGYGGLVHLNWLDKNAEISFIMDTNIEKDFFDIHWGTYLELIEEVAFKELDLHKLFIYAFDLRPHLYEVLKMKNYFNDAVLNDHCYFQGQYIDVVIYSKLQRE